MGTLIIEFHRYEGFRRRGRTATLGWLTVMALNHRLSDRTREAYHITRFTDPRQGDLL